MSKSPPLREDQHRARAQRHRVLGDTIGSAGDEWAAVPWFYSAYHLVRAAILRDPVWGKARALAAISVDLTPDDRFTERHHGRRRKAEPREWGLNELVLKLYRPAFRSYERLHQASISVRYGIGLPAGALDDLEPALAQIEEMGSRGELEAPILWTP